MNFFRAIQPTLTSPVSQACTQSQFDEAPYKSWCEQIREIPRFHRKQWEFCYILQALEVNGAIGPGRRGVGYGVGSEPLPALLAKLGCNVLATDMDLSSAQTKGWVTSNEHTSDLYSLNSRGICDPSVFAQNVSFEVADMNAIPGHFRDFDFTWSACCLEHLGSIRHGLIFIQKSLEALKPGGIAVHTTELNCSSDYKTIDNAGTVLFRKRDIRRLAKLLVRSGHKLKLNFSLGSLPVDRHIDVPPYGHDNHLKLELNGYVTTSFGLIIQKGSS